MTHRTKRTRTLLAAALVAALAGCGTGDPGDGAPP